LQNEILFSRWLENPGSSGSGEIAKKVDHLHAIDNAALTGKSSRSIPGNPLNLKELPELLFELT
jgi:hypothetical protein